MKNELQTTEQSAKKTKLQQRYESLLEDIEVNKALQESLENDLRKVIPRIKKEIRPLLKKRTDAVRRRIFRLDEMAGDIGVGKNNTEWFVPYIAEEAMNILKENGFEDEELISIYKKYTGESPLPGEKEYNDLAASIREKYGVEVNMEEMKKQGMDFYLSENAGYFQQKMAEKQEREEAKELEDFDPDKVQKVNKHEQLLAQDGKKIYMRLIKRFHPDLEQDEALKIQKTALVQEITKSYKEKDFLKLLSLQIEHIDEKENEGQILADDMLERYNKILSTQLSEIKREIEFIKYSSRGLIENFFDANSKFSERQFRAKKKYLKQEIESIIEDVRNSYRDERGWFKDWVRDIKDFIIS
ncbi:MAG: hypothetical protein ACI9V1_003454 [Spirosomataceae bacterium]|jgi:hypothetical protein